MERRRRTTAARLGLYLAALVLGVAGLFAPRYSLTIYALLVGLIVGLGAGSPLEAFIAAGVIGLVSPALALGSSIVHAYGIVAGIAGWAVAVIAVLYYFLAPALVALATRTLLSKK